MVLEIRRRIASLLANTGERALAVDGRWLGWTDFAAHVTAVERHLARLGIGEGDPVALVARNRVMHVAALSALVAGGRTTVMVHCALSAEGLAADIASLPVRAFIADVQDWGEEARAMLVRRGIPGLALLPEGHVVPLAPVERTPEAPRRPDVAFDLLSSGTTGAPKRIPLSWRAIAEAVDDAAAVYASGRQADTPTIVVHPIANVAGVTFLLPALAQGQPIVLLEKFQLGPWLEAVRLHRPARVSLPPPAIAMLIDAAVSADDLASLTAIGVGGGRLAPELQARFERRFAIPLLPGYGATEFGGVIANWSLELHARYGQAKRGSAGRARPGVELRIVNPQSLAPLPCGGIGLLQARVPRIGPELVTTSDLARIDADGFLYLEGRADQAINRGGYTIRPDDIADVLRTHPAVADAIVFAQPDERLGEVPVGLVELRGGQAPVPEPDLLAFARARLAAYQVPVRLVPVEALPRTGSFKISVPESRTLFQAAINQADSDEDVASIGEHCRA